MSDLLFNTRNYSLRLSNRYSAAIKFGAAPDRLEIIKRNRALAFLKTAHFDAVLPDTAWPNFGPNPSEKALFRAAEALYYLRRFSEATAVLGILHCHFPSNARAVDILKRAKTRCGEEKIGEYDLKFMQREAKKLRPPQLDHATYIGPIEFRETKDKGRGLFTTQAVKAGDLLLCEKAFAHAYAPESGETGNSKTTLLLNVETDRGFMGGQADLLRMIVQKLWRNPSVASEFTNLYHGDYEAAKASSVDGKPVVDT